MLRNIIEGFAQRFGAAVYMFISANINVAYMRVYILYHNKVTHTPNKKIGATNNSIINSLRCKALKLVKNV